MTRSIFLLTLFGVSALSLFGQTLMGFKSAVASSADAINGALALDSSIGATWSDAFIGSFPHFGIGLSAGATFTGTDAADKIYSALGQATPKAFKAQGIPIPATAATFRIGLPFIPADIALKGMIIPQSVADSLKSLYNVSAQYQSIGAEFRYAIVRESFFIPKVSLGAGVSYQDGSIVDQQGGSLSFTYSGNTITYTNPAVKLGWQSLTFDTSIQASKTVLFILTPYLGAGLDFGKTTVTGGIASPNTSPSNLTTMEAALAAAGEPNPFDAQGRLSYSDISTTPLVCLYGGFSLNIILVLDMQMMYVPATKALGGSLTARVQL